MTDQHGADSLASVIHKKKEAKKKQKTEGQSPIGNRTTGEGITGPVKTQEAIPPLSKGQKAKRPKDNNVERTRNQILNQEIDDFLYDLLSEGLIDDNNYIAFYAKACHTLGISTVNRIAVNSRNGKEPSKLFAYKTKGALNLHFKRKFHDLD